MKGRAKRNPRIDLPGVRSGADAIKGNDILDSPIGDVVDSPYGNEETAADAS